MRLGADEVVVSRNADEMARHAGSFDFILDAVAAEHELNAYIAMLRAATAILRWWARRRSHLPVSVFGLIFARRSFSGFADRGHPRDAGDARLLRQAQHHV